MKIQQHDGVVVDAAELRQGFAKQLLKEEEVLQGGGSYCKVQRGIYINYAFADCWGTLKETKNFLRFHQDPSMSSSSNE